jgi:hypothetical protein
MDFFLHPIRCGHRRKSTNDREESNFFMNFLQEKKYGVPSHNFVKKNVLWEKGDEITRFDGTDILMRLPEQS